VAFSEAMLHRSQSAPPEKRMEMTLYTHANVGGGAARDLQCMCIRRLLPGLAGRDRRILRRWPPCIGNDHAECHPRGDQEINCACQWREKIRGHCYLLLCDAVDEVVLAVSASLWRVGHWLAARLSSLTPWIRGTVGDPLQRSYPDEYAPSRDDFEYCQQFVIEGALRWPR